MQRKAPDVEDVEKKRKKTTTATIPKGLARDPEAVALHSEATPRRLQRSLGQRVVALTDALSLQISAHPTGFPRS
jgi:hypothetical protein